MLHYEGLVVPRKNSSSSVITTIKSLQTRVFCLRTDKSRDSDCINISCSSCLFTEENSTKFNKWYTEMKEAFEQKPIATIH